VLHRKSKIEQPCVTIPLHDDARHIVPVAFDENDNHGKWWVIDTMTSGNEHNRQREAVTDNYTVTGVRQVASNGRIAQVKGDADLIFSIFALFHLNVSRGDSQRFPCSTTR
jgi:hypothetical protein